ncbi:MAG TPA: hypothetical protein VKQ52_21390, partial [Puia sp.]|nr:hypothetical protein [Puia sp.]
MTTTTPTFSTRQGLSTRKKVLWLVGLLLALLCGPYIAVYLQYGGIPDKFFNFPATTADGQKPAPTLFMTVGITIVFIAALLLLLFPRLFGFKKAPPVARTAKRKARATLPPWFWVGLIASAGTLVFTGMHIRKPVWLNDWALLPLW